ncbi:TetR/AcrR family transcriptional regulator [Streptomyces sp. Lzd4kr]|nr:TetR/AcrR family transcriptional regulator [Streptomyces sp. Lzd4kr]
MTTAPQRKDAARNWERIVAVAREVVADGTPLQLNDIARRTGMGVGTVYRHFPTAEALLETVATPSLEALAAHGEQALAEANPQRALTDFLTRTIEAQVTDAALSPSPPHPRTHSPAPPNSSAPCAHSGSSCSRGPAPPRSCAAT